MTMPNIVKGNFFIAALILNITCLQHAQAFLSTSVSKFNSVLSNVNAESTSSKSVRLEAIHKRQTAVFDGAEFVSIASTLKRIYDDMGGTTKNEKGDYWEMPSTGTGYMTFVTATDPNSNTKKGRILAIEKDSTCNAPISDDQMETIKLEDNGNDVEVYKDSITTIPKGISDSDAISTAVAALAGVYCASVNIDSQDNDNKSDTVTKSKTKVIVLGGGEYACFTAKALDALNQDAMEVSIRVGNGKDKDIKAKEGVDVSLITTRPMALKDTMFNPLKDTRVDAMPPAIGDDELGFAEVVGDFDAIVDTLGDEANLVKVDDLDDGVERVFGEKGVGSKLKRDNQCKRYISTLTQSQRIVLKEGIIFARDPVLKYQKKIEKQSSFANKSDDDDDDDSMSLPPPLDYNKILQRLFDTKTIFPTDRNENGSHKKKKAFVRGCSFPDYAEIEIWPKDSTDGAEVRYGFPGIDELTLEAKVDKMMGSVGSNGSSKKQSSSKQKVQYNPFVTEIETLRNLREEIVDEKKTAVLFVSAPYCKLCNNISTKYTRLARISEEEKESDTKYFKASSYGKTGKQLTFTLQIESVPTFLLFRNGVKYGEPFGVTKLPSEKLDLAIEYLESGKDWDPEIMKKMGQENQVRTKLK